MPGMDDIFGPEPTEKTPETAVAPTSTNNLEEFDDIFGGTPAAEDGGASSEQAKDSSVGLLPAAVGSGTDEFDDIFGDSKKPVDAAVERPPDEDGRRREAAVSSSTVTDKDSGAAAAAAAGTRTSGGEREFLNFLYEDDEEKKPRKPISTGAPAPEAPPPAPSVVEPVAVVKSGARNPMRSGSPDSTSPLGEEGSFLEIPTVASPSQAQVESGGVLSPASSRIGSASLALGSPLNPHPAPASAAAAEAEAATSETKPESPRPAPPALQSFVRKEKVEVLRPLPADPAAALRELIAPELQATAAAPDADADADDSREKSPAAPADSAADDVDYARRLCAATGGFLPADLRPAVWSLLLGRGKNPFDAGFVKWRQQRRETPPSAGDTTAFAHKLDLRNDCLALARRLCDGTGENGGAGAVGSAKGDPEALASDVEEVRMSLHDACLFDMRRRLAVYVTGVCRAA